MRVVVTISDPWELGESIQWKPLHGELVQSADVGQGGGLGLILLDQPITFNGKDYRYLCAGPRHEGDTIESIRGGEAIPCGGIGLSSADLPDDFFHIYQAWRGGGLAYIGSITKE